MNTRFREEVSLCVCPQNWNHTWQIYYTVSGNAYFRISRAPRLYLFTQKYIQFTHKHTHIYTHKHTHLYTYTHTYIHTQTFRYKHKYINRNFVLCKSAKMYFKSWVVVNIFCAVWEAVSLSYEMYINTSKKIKKGTHKMTVKMQKCFFKCCLLFGNPFLDGCIICRGVSRRFSRGMRGIFRRLPRIA